MPYTFVPEHKFAKAWGAGLRISSKKAQVICRVISGKKLTVAKRLLDDLVNERRNLDGKYYPKAASEISKIIRSCEANARNLGLNEGALFVHASCHEGSSMRRPRRKGKFGSRLKMANIEVILVEKGAAGLRIVNPKTVEKTVKEVAKGISEKLATKKADEKRIISESSSKTEEKNDGKIDVK